MLAVLLAALSLIVSVLVASNPLTSTICIVGYLLMNIAYSMGAKNIPIIDVFIVALGFLLRVVYGGVATGIEVSSWMFLAVLSVSLFLALGKRRGEMEAVGLSARKSLHGYSYAFLNQMMYLFLGCGFVFYALWVFNQGAVQSVTLVASIPVSMYVCMRYCLALESGKSDGDPVEVVIAHKGILVGVFVWAALIAAALYL